MESPVRALISNSEGAVDMKGPKFAPRRNLRLGCAGIAMIVAGAAASTALAQTAPPVLEEIIVTTTKRVTNLQDVPASVAAVGGEKLDVLGSAGADIRFLSGRIPSVYAESSFGRTFPRFYIRGLGNNDFDLNSTQPVGLVYDDVVQENPLLRGFPAFDLERVEVARGPQGTLFGRNTPAGIISFVSKKPTQETDGYASISYGRFNAVDVEGAIGGALVENVLSARMSLLYQRRDDYVDNLRNGPGDDLEGYEDFAGRLQLLYDAGGPMTALFNVHYRDLDGTARVFRANAIGPGDNDLSQFYDRYTVQHDSPNVQTAETWGGSAKIEYDADEITLTSITGYESVEVFTRGDIDGGFGAVFLPESGPGFIPFPADTADEIPEHYQFSQEFRISSSGASPFQWQAGLYYFEEEVDANLYSYADATFNPAAFTVSTQENATWAVFGQGSYDVTDQLTLTLGLRYTDDEKDYVNTRTFFDGSVSSGTAEVSDGELTWDVSASYEANADLNLFARVAKGVRAPAIQGRTLFAPTVAAGISIADTETLISYEAGMKADLADGRARLNLAAFYYDVDDLQLTAVGGANNVNTLVNAAGGAGYGFEAELEFAPVDNLLMTAGLSYNDTEIQDSTLAIAPCGGGCTVTDPRNAAGDALIDGNPFPNAPKWIASATARYGMDIGSGEVFVFTDWAYRSRVNFFLYQSAEFQDDPKLEGGLRIGYLHGIGDWEVAAFVRNITNEESLEGGIDFNNRTGFVNEPRLWGVEATVRF